MNVCRAQDEFYIFCRSLKDCSLRCFPGHRLALDGFFFFKLQPQQPLDARVHVCVCAFLFGHGVSEKRGEKEKTEAVNTVSPSERKEILHVKQD